MGVHGMIEFGNRMLTGAVGLLAAACVVAALLVRPRRRLLVALSLAVFASIPAQAILGGITVRTGLNPWWVGGHFLLSMVVIALAYALVRAASPAAPSTADLPRPVRQLVWVVTAASAAVLVAGTVVTGSGPHAGDADARRTGLDPALVSQLHADLVALLVGLSVALWFALRAVGAPAGLRRAAGVLVLVELAQGLVGGVQSVLHLPALLVGIHMAGACAVWLATLAVLARSAAATDPPPPPPPVDHELSFTVDGVSRYQLHDQRGLPG
jgi:cytochrome c oxidase assembly protein subunit 15